MSQKSTAPRGVVWDAVPDECPECSGKVTVDDQAAMYCENSFLLDGECAWEPLEAPMRCPECDDEFISGDGCAWECEFCGYGWGTPSGRGDIDPDRSLETEVL